MRFDLGDFGRRKEVTPNVGKYEICCFGSDDNKRDIGGGGGSRTRVRKCYWSRDYMLIRVHALGITRGRSRPTLRTDKKR